MDMGIDGVEHSLAFWNRQEGVHTAGSWASAEQREQGTLFEKNGITFAFLSYVNDATRRDGIPVPAGREYLIDVFSRDKARWDVGRMRERGAEVIIVAMHWGREYTHYPTENQKTTANFLANLGVHLVIGTHPQYIQPYEFIGDTMVIYSLGNFLAAQRTPGLGKWIGLMVGVEILVDEESNVHFENHHHSLNYIAHDNHRNYRVMPFYQVGSKILRNARQYEREYLEKVAQPVIH
jgi:poly-gamma-glutamate synthesis protein (capsule biosynthesis protein)